MTRRWLGPWTLLWLGLPAACSTTRDAASGALEPRFVAVHNALAAMGLAEVGPIHEGSLAEGEEARVSLDLPAGCTTVVAFGGEGVRDVDATLKDGRGQAIAHDTTSEPQAVLRACVDGADAYVLVVKAASGAGHWVVATWAGGVGSGPAATGAQAASASQQAAGTCESPVPLAAETVSGSTRGGASVNTGSCDHSDAREMVYELDVPRRQRVIVDVDAHFDSVLYIRKDDCSDENAEVDCNDDSPTGGRNKSRIERVLEPGKYFVFVDGYNQESGAYKLTVSTSDVVALSDACKRAPRLAAGAVVAATTEGAANDAEASCGGGAAGQDAPWRFDLASPARVRLIEHSDEVAPVLHVRRACADAESETACGESRSGANEAVVTGMFAAGGYTVFADARERDSAGHYTLSLETLPAAGTGTTGDACGDAVVLAGSGGTTTGDTFSARDDLSGSCGGSGAGDVVYRLDVARRSRFQASLQGEEAPHVLVAWRRCGDGASELACGTTLDQVLAPGTYFVGVDGATTDALGRFALVWTVQDLAAQATACASAPVLTDRRTVAGTTAGAGDRFATSCGARDGAPDGSDRVFRFALGARARVKLELEAATFDAFLALRRSCGDAAGSTGGVQLACSAEADRARTTELEVTLDRGTYWVVVDGQSPNDQGSFTLRYSVLVAR
jgi:Bacterial pre-peptidase C-terminal domain